MGNTNTSIFSKNHNQTPINNGQTLQKSGSFIRTNNSNGELLSKTPELPSFTSRGEMTEGSLKQSISMLTPMTARQSNALDG